MPPSGMKNDNKTEVIEIDVSRNNKRRKTKYPPDTKPTREG